MSEVKTNAETNNQGKKLRRGISNETRAVSQLRFHEKDAAPNGLFVGHLHNVSVEWAVNGDGKQFAGLRVPRLVFEFCSNHANPNEMRHVYNTLFPVESNVDTIPTGSKAWQVDQVMKWIKHMLDTYYLKGRQLTDKEVDDLSLPFCDYDEEGNYVAVEPEEVLAGYEAIFRNVCAMFNGTYSKDGEEVSGKPIYKTADGKFISCWIKLLRYKKRKNEWLPVANGELGFDPLIGAGAIEIAKGNNPPTILMIDLAKESITPKETRKTPTIGGQDATMMGGVMAGAPMTMGASAGAAFNEAAAGGEMPF